MLLNKNADNTLLQWAFQIWTESITLFVLFQPGERGSGERGPGERGPGDMGEQPSRKRLSESSHEVPPAKRPAMGAGPKQGKTKLLFNNFFIFILYQRYWPSNQYLIEENTNQYLIEENINQYLIKESTNQYLIEESTNQYFM